MRHLRKLGFVSFLSMVLGTPAASAGPDDRAPGARLSTALGGTLDWDLGEAGELAHPVDYAGIKLYPGRAAEYRRRVAEEQRRAARSAMSLPPPQASR